MTADDSLAVRGTFSRSVSIVLPVYKQRDHIGALLTSMGAVLGDVAPVLQWVIVVNGPDDGSAAACREAASALPGTVEVLELAEAGWGRAVRAGIAASTGDLICFTNSARTTPSDLRTAIALGQLNDGAVIKAVRRFRDSLLRRLGSVLYNFESRALFGLASWDLNGTPKLFPRTSSALLELQEPGDLLDLEFLALCDRAGYQLLEYPVTSVARHGGTSTTKLRSAARMYSGAWGLRRRLTR